MTVFDTLHLRPPRDARKSLGPERSAFAPEALDRDAVPDEYLRSVDLTAFERHQGGRTVTVATWIAIVSCGLLGLVSLASANWFAATTLLAMASWCALIFDVSRHYGRRTAGYLLSGLGIFVVTVNLIEAGGLDGTAILAYPAILLFGGLILGKRCLGILTLGCLLSALLVVTEGSRDLIDGLVSAVPELSVFGVLLGGTVAAVWLAVDTAERYLDRIRCSEAKVRLAYERTLEAWARALEYRDRETEGHSRRVTELSVRLAREVGIEEPELTRIRWGALLHDIGKLAIPDRILLKPGPLSAEERDLMRQHTIYAREMLDGVPFLRSVVDIPYYHHERWDGQGYPEGLEAMEIPLPARIFAVVDQWEALSSDRPYRSAWRREEIRTYMQANSGIIFDPRIVEVFLDRVVAER